MILNKKDIEKLINMTGIEEGKTCLDSEGCRQLIIDTEELIMKKLKGD